MTKPVGFTYHQIIIQFRIPFFEDGSMGTPEVTKKFTTEFGGTKKSLKRKSKPKSLTTSFEETEEI